VKNLAHILGGYGISNFVLVTLPSHMRRSTLVFRALGLNPIPSLSASIIDDINGIERFLPSSKSLLLAEQAMHDYTGLTYYWFQG